MLSASTSNIFFCIFVGKRKRAEKLDGLKINGCAEKMRKYCHKVMQCQKNLCKRMLSHRCCCCGCCCCVVAVFIAAVVVVARSTGKKCYLVSNHFFLKAILIICPTLYGSGVSQSIVDTDIICRISQILLTSMACHITIK